VASTALRAVGPVDQIWAFPLLTGGKLDLNNKTVVPLDADGNFAYEHLASSYDALLALVDSTSCSDVAPRGDWTEATLDTRRTCVHGFVAVRGSQDDLISLPLSDVESILDVGEIPLGQSGLELPGDLLLEGLADLTQETTLESLETLARVDGVLQRGAELIANYSDSGEGVGLDHGFHFMDPTAVSALDGAFSNPSSMEFEAWITRFDGNTAIPELISGFSSTPGYLELAPPADILNRAGTQTYGPSSPATSTGAALEVDPGHWVDSVFDIVDSSSGGTPYMTGLFLDGFTVAPPGGAWVLRAGTDFVAKYDLLTSAPFVIDNGVADLSQPLLLIPRLFVNTEQNSTAITSVELGWALWNGASYEEIPHDVAVGIAASELTVSLEGDQGPGCATNGDLSPHEQFLTTSVWTPTVPFATGTESGRCTLLRAGVVYDLAGNDFLFGFGPP
jgi:hypothetical protein